MKIALVDLCGDGDIRELQDDGYWRSPLKALADREIPYLDFVSGRKTMDEKIASFYEALESDAELIWFVRGGVNCVEVLPILDWKKVATSKKIFYGLSDFSHFAWMASKIGSRCYYGQGLTNLEKYFPMPEDREFIFSFLEQGFLKKGIARNMDGDGADLDLSSASLIGGHLVIVLLMMLRYPVDLQSKYLFLEYHPAGRGESLREVGYYMKHLTQTLRESNRLPKGVVFGRSILPQIEGNDPSWEEINKYLKDQISSLGLPIYELDHFNQVVPFV